MMHRAARVKRSHGAVSDGDIEDCQLNWQSGTTSELERDPET